MVYYKFLMCFLPRPIQIATVQFYICVLQTDYCFVQEIIIPMGQQIKAYICKCQHYECMGRKLLEKWCVRFPPPNAHLESS